MLGFAEFVKAAIRNPKNVSTIFPSLKYLAQDLIVRAEIQEGDTVVELGCGSGAITRHLLSGQYPLGSYLGIEIDTELVTYLKQSFPEHKFVCASADNIKEHIADNSVDVVISSLPWTLFPPALQEAITNEIYRILKPGGRFSTFLCLHSLTYPGAARAKKLFKIKFNNFQKKNCIARNIPPANVYIGKK